MSWTKWIDPETRRWTVCCGNRKVNKKWKAVLPESLNKKEPNFWKTQKTYIKAILKYQKIYIKDLPKVNKNIYIKALNFLLKTGLNSFFWQFWKSRPKKSPNLKFAKTKFWSPNGSKSHPNGDKSSNLAPLVERTRFEKWWRNHIYKQSPVKSPDIKTL